MLRRATLLILALVLVATSSLLAQKTLTATEAKAHVGEQATVCGKVVSTRWAESSRGSRTFLNFDQPYPNQVFTLVIWGADRSKFAEPRRPTEASGSVRLGRSARSRVCRKSR